jgi:hypothetical protein
MLTGAHQRAIAAGAGKAAFGFAGGLLGFGRHFNNRTIPTMAGRDVGSVMNMGIRAVASGAAMMIPFAGSLLANGLSAGFAGGGGYGKWASEERGLELQRRQLADAGRVSLDRNVGDVGGYKKQQSNYRKGLRWADPAHNQRAFGNRSSLGHLNKMGRNMLFMGPLSPTSIGINSLIAGVSSGDDVFDPRDGVAHHFAAGVTGELGAMGGMGVGAALAKRMVPSGTLGVAIGAGTGMMLGAMAGMGLVDKVNDISAFGTKHGRMAITRKSTFQDSEAALTMRQRAMESINRSQFAVRSSLGQESAAFHS